MIEEDRVEQRLRAAGTEEIAGGPPDLECAARAAGLLDVAYATHETPVGRLLLAATPGGLVRVAYLDGEPDELLAQLARRISSRVLAAPRALAEPRRQLDEYFAGRRQSFDAPVDWRLIRGFTRRVLEVTAAIPYGSVATYKGVARQAGSPRGSRAAGNALGANPLPIVVPCHRVLASGGGLGGYTGGLERKLALLAVEGVQVALRR